MFLAGEEESTSFLKKRSKKLLLVWAEGRGRRRSPWPKVIKVFLLLFVHKKKSLPAQRLCPGGEARRLEILASLSFLPEISRKQLSPFSVNSRWYCEVLPC